MYQKEYAYAAIDTGADLILGHHAHRLKGIEVYKGKVIFYDIGNFAFDMSIEKALKFPHIKNSGRVFDPEYPTYAFEPEVRRTMIAKCIITDKKISRVSFLPAMVNKQGQPEVTPRSDKRSSEVLEHIERSCKENRLDTRFSREGDEIVIAV